MPTLEEYMAMRAPNTSGVDTRQVLAALANVPQGPPSYAFGMRVEDAQKEGAAIRQAAQNKVATVRDLQRQAVEDDKRLFDMAMQANQQVMADKRFELDQRVAEAEMAYKRASLGIQAGHLAVSRANLGMQQKRLQMEIERNKKLQEIQIQTPYGTISGDVAVAMPAGFWRRPSAQQLQAQANADYYVRELGATPSEAMILGQTKLPDVWTKADNAAMKDVKVIAPEPEDWDTEKYGDRYKYFMNSSIRHFRAFMGGIRDELIDKLVALRYQPSYKQESSRQTAGVSVGNAYRAPAKEGSLPTVGGSTAPTIAAQIPVSSLLTEEEEEKLLEKLGVY